MWLLPVSRHLELLSGKRAYILQKVLEDRVAGTLRSGINKTWIYILAFPGTSLPDWEGIQTL